MAELLKYILFFSMDIILGFFSPGWVPAIFMHLTGTFGIEYGENNWNLDFFAPLWGSIELLFWLGAVLCVLICLCWKCAQRKKWMALIPIAVFLFSFGIGILFSGGWDVFLSKF